MTFQRKKCIKQLVLLGIILVILQILLSSNFDQKTVYNTVTFLGVRNRISDLSGAIFNRSLGQIKQIGLMKLVKQFLSDEANNPASSGSLNPEKKSIDCRQNIETTKHICHEGHNGFELASMAHNVCISNSVKSPGGMKTIHAIPAKRLLYCPMAKIGSTFWRRVFYMLIAPQPARFKQPFDVPITTAFGQMRLFSYPLTSFKSTNLLSQSSFSFLFVRDPYSRLLSAFIDKLVPPNPTFWNGLGVKAIAQFRSKDSVHAETGKRPARVDGHDVTFAEFLKFVVRAEQTGKNVDEHFISINKGCKPCTYHYKYIGRMESFKDDALFIMRKMNSTVHTLENSFSDLTLDDAIADSIRSPFDWKAAILKYISWDKALQRVWLKLQMRGIIENKIKLDIAKVDVNKINVDQFIEMARKANKESDLVELKKQKNEVKKEAFASVPLSVIKAFRETFKADFDLFGYDSAPSYIFDREEIPQSPTHYFNYSHLN